MMPTERRANPVLAILAILAGALVGAILYLVFSRLGRFSIWATVVGVSLAFALHLKVTKQSKWVYTILTMIINIVLILIAEIASTAWWIASEYDIPFMDSLDLSIQGYFFYDGISWSDLRYVLISAAIIVVVSLVMHFRSRKTAPAPVVQQQNGDFGQNAAEPGWYTTPQQTTPDMTETKQHDPYKNGPDLP